MNFNLVTIGDLVADMIVSIPKLPVQANEHQPAHDIAIEAGGTGNVLIMAARLGLRTKALATIGSDFYGQQVLAMLTNEGVDVESVIAIPDGETAVAIVLVDAAAQHVFVGKHGSGAVQSLSADWREIIIKAGAIFTSGYDLRPVSTFSADDVITCLEIARQHNIPTFFDLGPSAFHFSRSHIEAAIAQTTVFLATLEEASTWLGINEPGEVAQGVLAQGPNIAIIKLGSDGCLLANHEEQSQVAGFPVDVRDTCGAGDAFDAACVYGYLNEFSLVQIGALANAVGGMTVTKLGTGTRLPQKREIRRLLQKHGHNLFKDPLS